MHHRNVYIPATLHTSSYVFAVAFALFFSISNAQNCTLDTHTIHIILVRIAERGMGNPEGLTDPSDPARNEGWASWAWSMVPQVLPTEGQDSAGSSSDESEVPPSKPSPVFDISFYNRKATLVVKVCHRWA